MTFNSHQMLALRDEIFPLIKDAHLIDCQEGDPRQFVLLFEKGRQHFRLFLSFQQPFLRFHLLTHSLKLHSSPLSQKIKQHLHDWACVGMEVVNNDRILKLTFQKGKSVRYIIGEFFTRKPNIYLLDEDFVILARLNSVDVDTYQLPEAPKESSSPGKILDNASLEQLFFDQEQAHQFQQQKQALKAEIGKRIKRAQHTKDKHKEELQECLTWPKLQHEGMMLQANLFKVTKGMRSVAVTDWENQDKEVLLTLDPKVPPKGEVEKRFRKAKKLKAGIPHHEKQILMLDEQLQKLHEQSQKIEESVSVEALGSFLKTIGLPKQETKDKKVVAAALPYREFITDSGLKIWVGKSAKDNDKLTFSYANGSDWWLHAHNFAGSHVVIRVSKDQEPDPESLKDAVQLALLYSKAKDQREGEVCLTQCKHVTRYGKVAGKVTVSKHKLIYAKVDNDRLQSLKKKNL